jgi:hypothetical protein
MTINTSLMGREAAVELLASAARRIDARPRAAQATAA